LGRERKGEAAGEGGSQQGGADAAREDTLQEDAGADPFKAVHFHFGDATLGGSLDFTHVYAFDRVFSPRTLKAFARALMASPFYVLISYRPCSEWWEHGLTIVQPIAKVRVQTTGKETMNVYVYINIRQVPGAAP